MTRIKALGEERQVLMEEKEAATKDLENSVPLPSPYVVELFEAPAEVAVRLRDVPEQ